MLVLFWCEYLRDGTEEGAKVIPNKRAAVELANKLLSSFGGCNTEFKLFELGKEVPLGKETVEEPQPSKKTTKFVV